MYGTIADAGVAGLTAIERMYLVYHRAGFAVAFDMERYHVRTRTGKELNLALGVRHHEVNVEERVGMRFYRVEHRASEGYILNKLAVHYIKVQPLCAAVVHARRCASEIGQIGVQYRGRYYRFGHCLFLSTSGHRPDFLRMGITSP